MAQVPHLHPNNDFIVLSRYDSQVEIQLQNILEEIAPFTSDIKNRIKSILMTRLQSNGITTPEVKTVLREFKLVASFLSNVIQCATGPEADKEKIVNETLSLGVISVPNIMAIQDKYKATVKFQ